MIRIILLSFILLLSTVFSVYASDKPAYPDGYRYWTHVKSLTLHMGHPLEIPFAGIHHIYANDKALKGLKSGRFPNDSVLVFDLLESVTADKASAEGQRKLIGLMVKSEKLYPNTGGWGFEAWKGNSRSERITNDGGASCFECHRSQEQTDYVFTQWRE